MERERERERGGAYGHTDRQTDRRTYREGKCADRQRDRLTERQKYKIPSEWKTDGEIARPTERETQKHTHTYAQNSE